MSSSADGLLTRRAALVLGLDDVGVGIARRFAREEAKLALIDTRDPALAGHLVMEIGAVSIGVPSSAVADATRIDQAVATAVRALGRLDVLVCNLLSSARPRALEQLDDTAVDESLRAIRATFAAMRAAFPALRDSGRGRVVLVAHRYGEGISEALGPYNAAAWSMIGLARTAAVDWGQYQIATNVLLPLARTAEFDAAHSKRSALMDRLVGQLPLRRVGDPVDDVGGAAALLASDAMCFVNGEVVHADGGQHVAGPILNPARFMS